MSASLRLFDVVVCVAGLAACGSVRARDDGGVDRPPIIDGRGSDGASMSEFASCAGLPATCGADGSDTCCNSPVVFGGTYRRSFDYANDPNSGTTSFPATISDLRLDKYEVTVGRFRAFVAAGMGTQANPPMTRAGAHANIVGSGWDASWNASLVANTAALVVAVKCDPTLQLWTDTPGANENRPMSCVTWFEAMAFCAWDGGYLPTETEWNYAAAGGDQQRAYPWSAPAATLTLDGAHASYYDGTNCIGDGMPDCTLTDLVAVGTKPAGDGRWGQSDLAGNVLEWTLDWAAAYPSSCTDCANLALAAHRETRGGSFASGPTSLRTGFRLGLAPSNRSSFDGFRCARGS
jgi:sulfatase modifying factor 1